MMNKTEKEFTVGGIITATIFVGLIAWGSYLLLSGVAQNLSDYQRKQYIFGVLSVLYAAALLFFISEAKDVAVEWYFEEKHKRVFKQRPWWLSLFMALMTTVLMFAPVIMVYQIMMLE